MIKYIYTVIILLILLLVPVKIFSQEPDDPINLIVLLDLSKRVSIDDQAERDQQIINSIITKFTNRQRSQFSFIRSKDILRFVVIPQERGNVEGIDFKSLVIQMDPDNNDRTLSLTAPQFGSARIKLLSEIERIYSIAIKKAENRETSGSDIWSFMSNEVTQYKMEGYQNRIFILTDGYFDFDKI